jgi:hypothetical protein
MQHARNDAFAAIPVRNPGVVEVARIDEQAARAARPGQRLLDGCGLPALKHSELVASLQTKRYDMIIASRPPERRLYVPFNPPPP